METKIFLSFRIKKFFWFNKLSSTVNTVSSKFILFTGAGYIITNQRNLNNKS